jgi:hypothetical protein
MIKPLIVGLLLTLICTRAARVPAHITCCAALLKKIETPDVSNVLYWKGEMAQSVYVTSAVSS